MKKVLAIDMGGTKIALGILANGSLSNQVKVFVPDSPTKDGLIELICDAIDGLVTDDVEGIGIGVPGLVNREAGIVYDLFNIPSWDEVPLGAYLSRRYDLPVKIDNDANCFALAEELLGGHTTVTLVGLTLGTGLGVGIVSKGQILHGANGGAGEFGMMPYLDHYIDYYATGQFFENIYKIKGEDVFIRATEGHENALSMYSELGNHIGHAINLIRLAVDPGVIVLGGSVTKGFIFFENAMRKRMDEFPFPSSLKSIELKVSVLNNGPLLGAGLLCD